MLQRRKFIKLLGGAAATWPLSVRAQQPASPVIGFLSSRSPVESTQLVAAFREGLKSNGFVEDKSVRIEYRWAEGQYDRLALLASDLVNRKVAAIAAVGNTPSAYAAKTATTIIPVVFVIGDDPVEVGLVDSLSHPRGNLTGVTVLFGQLGPKRLEVLHELMPDAVTIAMLINSNNPTTSQAIKAMQEAALIHRQKLVVQTAGTEGELETAFAGIAQQHAAALVVDADPFFTTRRDQLVALAARYAIPVMYPQRAFVVSGGLMSYGGDLRMGYRDAGGYIGRILNGAKPADLPVQRSTKVELVINLKTAKALGLAVPMSLLGRADEMIE
jgi:putative tryptophan/tyrosine transport system substrate-binding protein